MGTYYIKIVKDDYYSGNNYNLKVNFTESNDWETENNNSKENADLIKVNETYQGALTSKGDVDWYKFTTTSNGYFNIEFTHDLISSSNDYWGIYLYDSTALNTIDGASSVFYVDGNADSLTNTYGIPVGTYYIKIVKDDYYSGNNYNLKVNFTESNDWETENNNSKENADLIKVNETYQGALTSKGDVDWYKIVISEKGYFNILLEHELMDFSQSPWQIRVYDSTGVNYIDGCYPHAVISAKSNGQTISFGVEAGTYYIKVTNYDDYVASSYCIKVNFIPARDWESENNNSKNYADKISVNKAINGTISAVNDVDWYTFDVSSACELAITFDHKVLDSSSTYWYIYLYDVSGVTELLSFGRRGDTETGTTDYISVSSGTYYVKVTNGNYSGVNYSLIVQEKHDCIGDFSVVTAPTCTEPGIKEKNCTICGKLLDTQSIPANGHTCNDWVIDQEATCSREGERHCICSVCGETVTEIVNMLNHEYGPAVKEILPTCHSTGKETATCKNCGYSESATIPTLTHVFGEWYIAKEATCYADGTEERKCSLCGDLETKTIGQLTHEYGEWEVVSGSKLIPPIVKEKKCIHCGDVQSVKDWSNVWISIVVGIAAIGVIIGFINYIRAFKRR